MVIRLFVTLISTLLPYLMLYSKYLVGNLYIVISEHLKESWNLTIGKERHFVPVVVITTDFHHEELDFLLQNEGRET